MDELASDDDAAVLELNDDHAVGEEWNSYLDGDEQELDLRFDPQMGNLVRKLLFQCRHVQLLISFFPAEIGFLLDYHVDVSIYRCGCLLARGC